MRMLRGTLRITAVALLTVAGGVAISRVLGSGHLNMWALIAAIVLSVLSAGLDLWLGTRDRAHEPVPHGSSPDETQIGRAELSVADTGSATAKAGGIAVTGAARPAAMPPASIRVRKTGAANAEGPGSRAVTGIALGPGDADSEPTAP